MSKQNSLILTGQTLLGLTQSLYGGETNSKGKSSESAFRNAAQHEHRSVIDEEATVCRVRDGRRRPLDAQVTAFVQRHPHSDARYGNAERKRTLPHGHREHRLEQATHLRAGQQDPRRKENGPDERQDPNSFEGTLRLVARRVGFSIQALSRSSAFRICSDLSSNRSRSS